MQTNRPVHCTIRQTIKLALERAVSTILSELDLGIEQNKVVLEQVTNALEIKLPRKQEHGDYSCRLALRLAEAMRLSEMQLAKLLLQKLNSNFQTSTATITATEAGFLNFHVSDPALQESLRSISSFLAATSSSDLEISNSKAVLQDTKALNDFVNARIRGSITLALNPKLNFQTLEMEAPEIASKDWKHWQTEFETNAQVFSPLFADDRAPYLKLQRKLILYLDLFPELNQNNSRQLEKYSQSLAKHSNNFICSIAILEQDQALLRARMGLLKAICLVLSKLSSNRATKLP